MNIEDIKSFINDNYIKPNKKFIKFDIKNKEIWKNIIAFTNFLPPNTSISQRIWHVMNDCFTHKKCKNCNNIVKWNRNTYTTFCSQKCSNSDIEKKESIKNIMNERYGGIGGGSDIILEKIKQTNKERYGEEILLNVEFINNKIRQTNKERYGCANYAQTKDFKIHSSNLQKNRTDEIKKEIVNKIRQTNINRYGVDSYAKTEAYKKYFNDLMNKKYGVGSYKQSLMPSESLVLLNDRMFLENEHVINKKSCQEIAKNLQVHIKTVIQYLKKHNIPQKYYYESDEQKEIKSFINSLGVETQSNVRNLIKNIEIDIFIFDKKIAIEYCGLYWHSELYKSKEYHKLKYDLCKKHGYRLITIFQNEWIHKRDIVESKLKNILNIEPNMQNKIFARKCKIKEINQDDKKEFFNKYHIQGDGPSSINYGLYYNNELAAVIGFIKQKDHFILNRYATSYSVLGGFTKLLTHFERIHNNPKILTFADLRWSDGDLYKNTGFVLNKILPPDYYYIDRDTLIHKFNFRHRLLENRLTQYDPELSEHQNCLNNKIYRIYDCGKLRFIKNI